MEELERCLSFHHQNWQPDMWNILLLFLSKWELHISKTGAVSVWVKWLAKHRALQVPEVGVHPGAASCVNGELFNLFGTLLINLESGDNKRAYFSGLLWGFTEMKHGDYLAPCLVYNKLLLKVTHYFLFPERCEECNMEKVKCVVATAVPTATIWRSQAMIVLILLKSRKYYWCLRFSEPELFNLGCKVKSLGGGFEKY